MWDTLMSNEQIRARLISPSTNGIFHVALARTPLLSIPKRITTGFFQAPFLPLSTMQMYMNFNFFFLTLVEL